MRFFYGALLAILLSASMADAQTVICSAPFHNTAGATIAGGLHVSESESGIGDSWVAQSSGRDAFILFLQSQNGSEYEYNFSFKSNADNEVMEVDLFAGDVSCFFHDLTTNGHNAWVKSLAKSSAFPLSVWAGVLGGFATALGDANSGVIAAAIGVVAVIAQKMGEDPPDCTDGIAPPDFSNVPAFDGSLVGIARLASRMAHNAGMIEALGESAITAQNRMSCPTRSADGVAEQFTAAQGFTNRMGNRLLNLQNQMVRASAYAARKGMAQTDVDTLNQTLQAAGDWGMSLASGATD
jgi:hypothetical protein